jgi:hypothetical protein
MAKARYPNVISDTELDILIENYDAIGEERMSIHQFWIYNSLIELRILRELDNATSQPG